MVSPDPAWSQDVDGRRIRILPVLHERIEFAEVVRLAWEHEPPDSVVVEIPSSLEKLWLQAVRRLPAISVLLYQDRSGQTIYLPVHPGDPMVEAARRALDAGIPVRCGDLDVDGYADYRDSIPDSFAVTRLGYPAFLDAVLQVEKPRDPHDDAREASMAYHVQESGPGSVLVVCGMHHAMPLRALVTEEHAAPLTPPRRQAARLVHLHPESLGEVLHDLPFFLAVHEVRRLGLPPLPEPIAVDHSAIETPSPFRVLSGGAHASTGEDALRRAIDQAAHACQPSDGDGNGAAVAIFDRLRVQRSLLAAAETSLRVQLPDEDVHSWQRRNLARYSRNLALHSGMLTPDLFDLIVATRGCVSENYASEVLRIATSYPDQAESAVDLPTAKIRADEMFDGVRRVRLQPRRRRPKRGDWGRLLRQRRKEKFPGEWLTGFDSDAICSFPPEDLIIEEFGRYLQKRGKQVLSDENSRTVPFTTSVLDGIDVRETIRHWSEGRLYVRESGRTPGEVGSVVIVFDDDETRYPYEQTWLGEHDQESDMAFFSTDPAQGIAGPGICRVTYGGLMLSHPPRRMADVWTDPDYRMAETRGELLLLAAMDYSTENLVVHVAAKPPRSILRQLASRLGIKIQHLPIGTLSPTTLKRIRVMHILSGYDKRNIAPEFIS